MEMKSHLPPEFANIETQSHCLFPQDLTALDENSTALKSKGNSYCRLLWEGVVKERAFKQWKIHTFKNEAEARKLLADRQAVSHQLSFLCKGAVV